MSRVLKGQSAMEYLMTYGWALLVIVIVIAVLIYINPFRAPEQCVFDQAGFLCQKPILQVSGTSGTTPDIKGLFHATLVNGNQKTVKIVALSCIKGRTAPNGDMTNTDSWPGYTLLDSTGTGGKTLGYQEQIDDLGTFKTDAGADFYVSCVEAEKTADGYAKLPPSPTIVLRPNEDFSGRLYVAYKYADDSATTPAKIVGANLVTRSQ